MDAQTKELKDSIDNSGHIVAVTGAGISAASGRMPIRFLVCLKKKNHKNKNLKRGE